MCYKTSWRLLSRITDGAWVHRTLQKQTTELWFLPQILSFLHWITEIHISPICKPSPAKSGLLWIPVNNLTYKNWKIEVKNKTLQITHNPNFSFDAYVTLYWKLMPTELFKISTQSSLYLPLSMHFSYIVLVYNSNYFLTQPGLECIVFNFLSCLTLPSLHPFAFLSITITICISSLFYCNKVVSHWQPFPAQIFPTVYNYRIYLFQLNPPPSVLFFIWFSWWKDKKHQKPEIPQHLNSLSQRHLFFPSYSSSLSLQVAYNWQNSELEQQVIKDGED